MWLSFALCLAFFVCGCSGDRRESFCSSLSDADKDGAITRGWIPDDVLPRSSHAIREIHELSPSRQRCSFEFLRAEWQTPKSDFKSVDSLPPSLTHVRSPGFSWWPAVLRGYLDVGKIQGEGLKLYVVERPSTSVTTDVLLFAIDGVKGRGFFYRTGK